MKIVFMGTPQAAVPAMERMASDGHEILEVWTQPDRPSGRGRRLTAPPVKEFAQKHGLALFQPEKIKTRESRERFVSLDADAAVVVAYGKILPKTYLEAFPMGAINVHFSLLPKYRGAAPVNWAIAEGERVTGVTTMKMDEGMDTGDILLQRSVEIADEENAVELMERLAHTGASLLSDTLRDFDQITPVKQDESAATYARMLEKGDGRLEWSLKATEVVNRIRGFQPFPRSYSTLKGSKITLWSARPCQNPVLGEPGLVVAAGGSELVIACGDSTGIRVLEIQAAGKSRMKTQDFLNSGFVTAGDIFGNDE